MKEKKKEKGKKKRKGERKERKGNDCIKKENDINKKRKLENINKNDRPHAVFKWVKTDEFLRGHRPST